MKKLTRKQIQWELNEILLRRNLIQEPIDFELVTFAEGIQIVMEQARVLEFKAYQKSFKRPTKDLRRIYTLLQKYFQHENRKLLFLRKNLDQLK